MGRSRLALAGAVAAASFAPLVVPAPAFGQGVPSSLGVPGRDELKAVTQAPVEQAPQLSIKGGIERSPCPLGDPQYADIKVTISSVDFNGLKGASAADMEPAWKPFADKPQPISTICEIRDAAATILRNKGYLAAVQVPTQRIENGNVKLEVLYARVKAIRARGETKGAERKLEDYLNKITEGEIFDRFKAERYLLLARDLPGYNVQLTLRPSGDAPGDLIGEVTVLRQPYTLDLTVQNLAAPATGRWGGQLRAQVFGITGLGDATTLSYYATADFKEQHILQASHEFRPGSQGLVLGGQFTYAWTKPSLGNTGPALKARTLFASLYGRYPLLRTQARNVWLASGFDFINQDVDVIGPLTRDKLRVGWARLDFDGIDTANRRPQYRYAGSFELRQGLDVLDATRTCIGAGCALLAVPTSRNDGSPGATVLRAQGELEVAAGRFSIAVAPRAQVAFKPVLSFEEFSAGNYTIGRGYDPGTIAADSGVGYSVELRGPHIPVRQAGDITVQPFVFTDAAWVFNKGQPGSQHLSSVGVGARAELGARFRLDTSLAVPTERAGLQTTRGNVRFLVTLTARLLPWRTN
ncbi:ShlB/FhaC/HecB family hemolysin secretion/activation protein [Novosphingobium lentum]|uniref:ShlB/FhaC/HecB family hemolysin secretion/activation protein n=1 Tax=Novosphingobium lentum TaxID=145287 RepID=UPI00082BA76B|nr:ShlB/FhaC/HecB family hemolysin secretion/activation protein [Novosphingobium lentum]